MHQYCKKSILDKFILSSKKKDTVSAKCRKLLEMSRSNIRVSNVQNFEAKMFTVQECFRRQIFYSLPWLKCAIVLLLLKHIFMHYFCLNTAILQVSLTSLKLSELA